MRRSGPDRRYLDQARQLLVEAHTIDEVKDVWERAEAIRQYLRTSNMSIEIQNYAAEIKIRAERKMGELLAERERPTANQHTVQGDIASPSTAPSTLAALGVTKMQSSRAQAIASIPAKVFEAAITEKKARAAEAIAEDKLVPIVVDGDLLIDGRNRLAACELAGVGPLVQDLGKREPIALILSANLQRRHMTKGQAAILTARAELFVTNTRQVDLAAAAQVSRSRIAKAAVVNRRHLSKGQRAMGAAKGRLLNNLAASDAARDAGVSMSGVKLAAVVLKYAPELADLERREIELEENLQREDLTAYEQARVMVGLGAVAGEVLRQQEADLLADSANKSKKGRPRKVTSGKRIAERTGIPRRTLGEATAHVETVDTYVPTAGPAWPQYSVLELKR